MWFDSYSFATGVDFPSATTLTYSYETPPNPLSRQTSVPLWPLVAMIDRFPFGKPNQPGL